VPTGDGGYAKVLGFAFQVASIGHLSCALFGVKKIISQEQGVKRRLKLCTLSLHLYMYFKLVSFTELENSSRA
jgi:hypothetical protein